MLGEVVPCYKSNGITMENDPIILFDGCCNLCSRSVQFIINHDSERLFKFVPLQSKPGESLIAKVGKNSDPLESMILIEGSRSLMKSDAIIRIFQQLPGKWAYLSHISIIPKPIRDKIYDLIARYRHKWFGQQTSCPHPFHEDIDKFNG
jgi:predicted DCC family thiol-disulfide oxidoreductase YuxK